LPETVDLFIPTLSNTEPLLSNSDKPPPSSLLSLFQIRFINFIDFLFFEYFFSIDTNCSQICDCKKVNHVSTIFFLISISFII